tara:strand:- start:5737 stop:6681 length:945 start_codon:yes stop_codon:yes gene_type:complete
MKAFFLTAGFATRFRPYSEIVPKPMMPFMGMPLMLYTYEFLKEAGVDTAIFNLHHQAEKMRLGVLEYIKDSNLIFSLEEPNILGSGGALLYAKKYLNEDFFLANGDEVFFPDPINLNSLYEQHINEKRLATFFCTEHPQAGKEFGALWLDDANVVRDIGKEKFQAGLKAKHYVGMAILSPEIFHGQDTRDCNILYDILYPHLASKRLYAENLKMEWFEMGNAKSYLEAHGLVASKWNHFSQNALFQKMMAKYLSSATIDTRNGVHISYGANQEIRKQGFSYLAKGIDTASIRSLNNAIVIGRSAETEIENQIII